jgi:myo-inositol-hexaphosphate 3-phosphohydrolase
MAESQTTTLTSVEVQNVESHDAHAQKHSLSSELPNEPVILDIEHAVVEDDPRIWSHARKARVSILLHN